MTPTSGDAQLQASTASVTHPICTVCKRQEAIYTCPRCTLRSCSSECSSLHKKAQNCSGERNKAAYVPMNEYTWGTMMNDYVFLEEMGRKVGGCGNEIIRGGYVSAARGDASGKRKWTRTKRDVLKLQLAARDIEMELLPQGMERKKMNQSYWDFKKKTGFLTIEFKLHACSEPPFRLLTHRNDMNTPLLKLIQMHLSTTRNNNVPPWAKSLVMPDDDNPESFSTPSCVMPAQRDVVPAMDVFLCRNKVVYHEFDATQPMSTLLKGTRFVEFPTIEVREEFHGTVMDRAGVVSRIGEERPRVKRRKLDKDALAGLLGDYGSGEEREEESHVLVEYNDSTGDEEESEGSVSEYEERDENVDVNPESLLQLLQEAKRRGQWTQDDEVDWGESSEGEAG